MIAGPSQELNIGVGSHTLQDENGRYLLVVGNSSQDVRVLDDGFKMDGSYLSEALNPPGIGGWNTLRWSATVPAGSAVDFRLGTAVNSGGLPGTCAALPRTATDPNDSDIGGAQGEGFLRVCAQFSRSLIPASGGSQAGVWLGESSVVYDRISLWPVPQLLDLAANYNAKPLVATGLAVGSPGSVFTNTSNPPFSWSDFSDDPNDISDPLQPETVARLQVQVDENGGGFGTPVADSNEVTCSGTCASFTPSNFNLTDGVYQFRVRRRDNGVPFPAFSEYSAAASFTVDTVRPVVTGALTAPSAAGLYFRPSQTVSITWNVNQVTDTNLAANPILLEFTANGSVWTQIADNEANDGTYSWTVPAGDTQTARVRIRARDQAGNLTATDAATASVNPFVIDGTVPQAVAPNAPAAASTVSGLVHVPITWAANGVSDLNFASVRLQYQVDNGVFLDIASGLPNNGSFSWDSPPLLSSNVRLKLIASDRSGNTTEATGPQFAIDSTLPAMNSATLTFPNGGQVLRGGAVVEVTWSANTITDTLGLATNPISLIYTFGSVDGVITTQPTANDGAFSWTVPTLDVANVRVRLTAMDRAGNSSSDFSNANFRIDSTAPSSSLTTAAGVYGPQRPWPNKVTGSASDSVGVASVGVTIRQGAAGSYWNGTGFQTAPITLPAVLTGANFERAASLPDGSYTITSLATDTAGNPQTSAATVQIIIDRVAPTVAILTSGLVGENDYEGAVEGSINDGAAGSGAQSVQVTIQRRSDNFYWNGQGWVSQASQIAADIEGQQWSVPLAPAPNTYDVTARGVDAAGNQSTAVTGNFIYDSTKPTSSLALSGLYNRNNWPGRLMGTAQANRPGTSISFVEVRIRRISDGTYWNGSIFTAGEMWLMTTGTTNWTYNFIPPQDGTFEAASRAQDSGGLAGNPTIQQFVFDSTGPALTLTKPLSRSNSAAGNPANPTLIPVEYTAVDATSGLRSLSLTFTRSRGEPDPGSPHTEVLDLARGTVTLDGEKLDLVPGAYYRISLEGLDRALNFSQRGVSDWLYVGNLPLNLLRFVSASATSAGNGSAGQPFRKISDALVNPVAGMAVLVAPGTYSQEVLPLAVPSQTVILGAGPDVTRVQGGGATVLVRLAGVQQVEVSNLALSGTGTSPLAVAVDAYATDETVRLRNLLITGGHHGLRINEGTLSVAHLTISDNTGHGIWGRYVRDGGEVTDNIVTFSGQSGLYAHLADSARDFGELLNYSDLFGNTGTDFAGPAEIGDGTGNISEAPAFRRRGSNYALRRGSPAQDAGNPQPSNNDPDGSPGDMGAFGGESAVSADELVEEVPARIGVLGWTLLGLILAGAFRRRPVRR